MVVRANRKPAEPGGHIASFQSSAKLYEIGYNHFWKGPDHETYIPHPLRPTREVFF